ncbi:MAG: DUF2029 domain-containing protein [Chloroflexi bacterium]|nr:DUF2029 domain-containing protein [Chloroflexota bacterium]
MQLARRPISRSTIIGAGLLALALVLDIIATNRLAIALGPASDLFPRWVGARAWVIDNLDPYSPGVTATVRSAMGEALGWDGTADSGAFAFGFVYPGYVALLLAPLAVLPFPAASTIWLLIAQASVVGTVWLAWHTPSPVRLHDTNRGLVIATVLAILWPPVIYNLIFGQFAALATLAIATAGWATARRHDRFAGSILPLALVKPQLALIPVALWVTSQVMQWSRTARQVDHPSPVGTWAGDETRNWHGIAAFSVTVATVGTASLVALPHWPGAFLDGLGDYAVTARATTTIGIIASVIASGPVANAITQATLIGALFASVIVAAGPSARTSRSLLPAGILIGAWMIPPVYEWNHVVGLLILVPWVRNSFYRPAPSPRDLGTLRFRPCDGRPPPPFLNPTPASLQYAALGMLRQVRGVGSAFQRWVTSGDKPGVFHSATTWRWTPAITWGITNIVTLPLAVLWPDGSRAVWPVILLGAWVIDHRARSRAPLPTEARS